MNSTESPHLDPQATIAPGEVRELIARLTEQSVEAVPAHKARTLEGLAVETGISVARLRAGLAEMRRPKRNVIPLAAYVGLIVLAGIGYWAVVHTPPPVVAIVNSSVVNPKVIKLADPTPVDLSGTVDVSTVTYGPDSGSMKVDPSFEPTVPLPEGLSISASVGNLLWGSGDHRSSALEKPFSDAQVTAITANVTELLNYVRQSATRRHVATDDASANINTPKGAFPVQISASMYNGGSGSLTKLPPPGAENDIAAAGAIQRAAKTLVASIQNQLKLQAKWRRENGP